jgi:hypothetical protein
VAFDITTLFLSIISIFSVPAGEPRFYKIAAFPNKKPTAGTYFIHKLFTKDKKARPKHPGRTFGFRHGCYFTATASISTSAPIGSAATS